MVSFAFITFACALLHGVCVLQMGTDTPSLSCSQTRGLPGLPPLPPTERSNQSHLYQVNVSTILMHTICYFVVHSLYSRHIRVSHQSHKNAHTPFYFPLLFDVKNWKWHACFTQQLIGQQFSLEFVHYLKKAIWLTILMKSAYNV